jgi:hypothetical protein
MGKSIKEGLKEDLSLWTKGFKAGSIMAIPIPGPKKIKAGARAVGGIIKEGEKFVSKVYRNMGR